MHAVEAAQKRRLPTPRGPNDRRHLAFGDAQRDAAQGVQPIEPRVQVVCLHRGIAFDQRRGMGLHVADLQLLRHKFRCLTQPYLPTGRVPGKDVDHEHDGDEHQRSRPGLPVPVIKRGNGVGKDLQR